jgi:hypothetical protein
VGHDVDADLVGDIRRPNRAGGHPSQDHVSAPSLRYLLVDGG